MTSISPSAQKWLDFTTALGEIGLAVHEQAQAGRTPEQMAEVNRALMIVLASGTLFQLRFDPDRPDWMPRLNSSLNMCAASPDNTYSSTPINGKGTYLIKGFRGTNERILIDLDSGMMGYSANDEAGMSYAHYGAWDVDDFAIASDGTFEIIASAQRPDGHAGNWIALNPDDECSYLLMRQISHDPAHEQDGWMTIRRIDPGTPRERPFGDIDDRLAGLPEVVGRTADAILKTLRLQDYHGSELNTLVDYSQKFGNVALVANQSYFGGRFSAAADEAIVIEIRDLVGCKYWNAHLLDSFWGAAEFMFQQTSLNKASAAVDPDGVIRLVISQADPGVANWLDKSDYPEVGIRMRFNQGNKPVITSRKVPLADLRAHLHPDTPAVNAEQRQELLGERIEGLQRRRRW